MEEMQRLFILNIHGDTREQKKAVHPRCAVYVWVFSLSNRVCMRPSYGEEARISYSRLIYFLFRITSNSHTLTEIERFFLSMRVCKRARVIKKLTSKKMVSLSYDTLFFQGRTGFRGKCNLCSNKYFHGVLGPIKI